MYDNDVHCAIDGYGKMAQLRQSVSDTAWVAVVSSGDYLQGGTAGAYSKGQYIADIMHAMDYDAVTLGNHEFDFGIPRMRELLAGAALPVTCVNLFDHNGDSLVYAPYIIKRYGDRRVAFVGVVTPNTYYTEQYAFVADGKSLGYDLCAKDVYGCVQKAVDAARKEGADYVIVLSHLGESTDKRKASSTALVAATSGIDAVLDAHSHAVVECHKVLNRDGKPVPITQTGTQFANIGKLFISRQGDISTRLIAVSSLPRPDVTTGNKVQMAVDSVKGLMAQAVSQPVCYSPFPLTIHDSVGRQQVRYMETNAGDVVADALRAFAGADIGIINGGAIRTKVAAGTISVGDVIALMPYDNPVSLLEVRGSLLARLLSACCSASPTESGDFPQVSGIRFRLVRGKPNKVTDIEILDSAAGTYVPLDTTATYRLATVKYCISGGGLRGMLRDVRHLKDYPETDTGVLVWYLREYLQGIMPDRYRTLQGRIY